MTTSTTEAPRTEAQRRGDEAEERAARYFEERGFSVLERKFKARLGEVDLVVQKGLALVFVEVRYRRTAAFGAPEETVSRGKRRKVVLAALEYCRDRRLLDRRVIRFDVVAVIGGRPPQILHLEDAFDAELPRLAPPPDL